MKRYFFSHTVRGRLLFLAIGIELVMLTVMVVNSMRLLHSSMTKQAHWQASQIAPILNAALEAPVAQQDYATIQAVIDESRATEGIDYVLVTDKNGNRLASSGIDVSQPLPLSSNSFTLLDSTNNPRYNVHVTISSSGQRLGNLYFGLNLTNIISARNTLLSQGVIIAALEIVFSTIILMLVGLWLTRHLSYLTKTSLEVAAGNLTPAPVPEGSDDIGQLGIAFNTMSSAIAERIYELTTAKEQAELSEKSKTESEERLKLVLDGSNDGIWDWDIQSGRIEINRRWAEMIGYEPEELERHISTWVNLVHPEDLPSVQEVLNEHLEGRRPLYETEHRVRTKTGEWLWILDRGKVVVRDSNGMALRAAGTHTDITARKKAEELLYAQATLLELEISERKRTQEELALKQIQLELINNSLQQRIDKAITELREKDQLMISQSRQAAMGEMIGNIAHQWRQPLNALAMVIGNIKAAYHYNELTTEYLDKAFMDGNRLIQKMSTTINDFRNFFRPDKEMAIFSALEQINTAIALLEPGFNNHNIFFKLEAKDDVMLTGFPNEYSQVLVNLFSNAREAIQESEQCNKGLITVQLRKEKNMGVVLVKDNGCGIPESLINTIFEPYFSTKKMGTGIGLYMSKMIIERSMNGVLAVHDNENGAEFIIKTPIEV